MACASQSLDMYLQHARFRRICAIITKQGAAHPTMSWRGGALLQPDAERRCRSRARVGRQLFVVVDIKQSLGALHCPETAHGSGRHVVVDHDVGLRLRREGSVSRTHGHGAKAVEVGTKYPF